MPIPPEFIAFGTALVAEFPSGEVERLAGLRAWAEAPENHYTIERVRRGALGTFAERHRRVLVLERVADSEQLQRRVYGITFTISESAAGGFFRHVSVSVDRCTHEPNRIVLTTLLHELGFRGAFEGWIVRPKPGLPHAYEIFEPFTVN